VKSSRNFSQNQFISKQHNTEYTSSKQQKKVQSLLALIQEIS